MSLQSIQNIGNQQKASETASFHMNFLKTKTTDAHTIKATNFEPPLPVLLGLTGATGSTGPLGQTGIQGPQGASAIVGDTGLTGHAGFTGINGLTGLTGPNGSQGQRGQTGPKGVTGVTGGVGPTGQNGMNGSIGASGPAGLIGQQGIVGPTGPASNVAIAAGTGILTDPPVIISSGTITTQPIGFIVSLTSTYSYTENNRIDNWDQVYGLSLTTGAFTIPYSGLWRTTVQVLHSTSNVSYVNIDNLSVNVIVQEAAAYNANTDKYVSNYSFDYPFSAGNIVSLRSSRSGTIYYSFTGGSIPNTSCTQWSMFYLGQQQSS